MTMWTQLCTLRTCFIVMQSKLAIATVKTSSLGFEMEDEQSWTQASSQPSHGLDIQAIVADPACTVRTPMIAVVNPGLRETVPSLEQTMS